MFDEVCLSCQSTRSSSSEASLDAHFSDVHPCAASLSVPVHRIPLAARVTARLALSRAPASDAIVQSLLPAQLLEGGSRGFAQHGADV